MRFVGEVNAKQSLYSKMFSFDNYLETRIKSGPYQLRVFLIVAFVDFIDAMETAFLGIFLSILAYEWKLTTPELIWLGTAFYIGMVTGHAFCALFADYYGRKNSLILGTFLTFLTFIVNSQVQKYWEVFVLRLAYGSVFGMIMPLSSVLLSEMVTKNYRGRTQTCLLVMYICGKIYLIFTCYLFLDNLQEGNWRGLLLFNSIPALLCCVLSVLYLRESARFYLSSGKYVDGINEMKLMGRINQGEQFDISQKDQDRLIQWQIRHQEISKTRIRIIDLFRPPNRSLTLRLAFIFVAIGISSSAVYILTPFLLAAQAKGFSAFLYINFTELVAVIILYNFIDNRNIGGRKRTIIISLACMSISLMLIFFRPDDYMVIGLSSYKFFISFLLPSIILFTNESFSTVYRSMGLGTLQAISRTASIFTPAIAFTLFTMGTSYVFIVLTGCVLLALCVSLTFTDDKTQLFLEGNEPPTSVH